VISGGKGTLERAEREEGKKSSGPDGVKKEFHGPISEEPATLNKKEEEVERRRKE